MILDTGVSKIRSVKQIPNLYIVENKPLEGMLFDRNLMGWEFRKKCLESTRLFLGHILDEIPEDTSEIIILSKGLMYQVTQAYGELTGNNMPVNLIATKRASVQGNTAKIVVPYSSLDAGGSTLVIGDTVATGATIVAAVEEYSRTHKLKKLYVFSYAGAKVGAEHIAKTMKDNDIELTMLFGLAAFGLADNGFDLSFVDKATITKPGYRKRAAQAFGNRPVSAVGWDFGSQSMSPKKYQALAWVESEYWGLQDDTSLGVAKKPANLDIVRKEADAFATNADHLRKKFL